MKALKNLLVLLLCLVCFVGITACKEENPTTSSPSQSESSTGDNSSSNGNEDGSQDDPSHEHNYTLVVTEPTCTEQGFTTHSCSCGVSYKDTYVDALNHEFLNYISDGNATYEKDGTKTATCNREGCGVKDTLPDVGSMLIKSAISFKSLSVNGTNAYGKVSNETTTFSFINEVSTTGNAKYTVSTSITGAGVIASKTISLNLGDNIVYITETVDGEPVNLYTVTIRRRLMYDVFFETNGGSTVLAQKVEEDSVINEPTTMREGYTFEGWDYDFSKPITKNENITASWVANRNTPYKVEYYLQNIENDDFSLKKSENKFGVTDATAVAEVLTFEHFEYKVTDSVSGNIAPNGSTVLKVYYTRKTYTVEFKGNGGVLFEGTTLQHIKYGDNATAPVYKRTGYEFIQWDESLEGISADIIITAEWEIIAYNVVYENLKGASNPNVLTYTIETGFSLQNLNNVNGYDFAKWEIDGIITSGASVGEYGDKTITAVWNAIYTLNGDAITGITAYGGKYSSLTIPEEIDGVTIVTIADGSFLNNASIKEMNIGHSINTIGENSFAYSDIESVNISGAVETIGAGAFSSCSQLKNVSIGVNVDFIGEGAFKLCELECFTVDSNNNAYCSIDGNLFNKECTILIRYATGKNDEVFTIPNSVVEIGENAFNCAYFLKTVVFGENVKALGKCAFQECTALKDIRIPESVETIEESAFMLCGNLEIVTIPSSVNEMGATVFYGCDPEKLTVYCQALSKPNGWETNWRGDGCAVVWDATLNENNEVVYTHVYDIYYDCGEGDHNEQNITKYTLNDLSFEFQDAIRFGYTTRWKCRKMELSDGSLLTTTYYYPNTLEDIVEWFGKAGNIYLEAEYINERWEIKYEGLEDGEFPKYSSPKTSYTIEDEFGLVSPTREGFEFLGWKLGDDTIYMIEKGTFGDLVLTASWKQIVFDISWNLDGGTISTELPLSYNINDGLVLPTPMNSSENVISFAGWYDGENVITEISGDLGDVVLTALWNKWFEISGNTILSVTDYVKNEYKNITIPESIDGVKITNLASGSFKNFIGLEKITVPNSIKSIGYAAFNGCSNLQQMFLPFIGASQNATVDKGLFGYIFGEEQYIGSDFVVQYYSNYEGARGLYSIPKTLTFVQINGGTVGYGAFYGCANLESITIIGSMTAIGEKAFFNCENLIEISISNNVKTIGEGAFAGCSSLETMVLPIAGGGNSRSETFGFIFGTESYGGSIEVEQCSASYKYHTYYIPSSLRKVVVSGNTVPYAFHNCTMITEIELNGTNVAEYSLDGCTGLKTVKLASTISHIYQYAFGYDGTISIEKLYFEGTIGGWCENVFESSLLTNVQNFYINNELVVDLVIPDGVNAINDNAFDGCNTLESVKIGNNVLTIGCSAFAGCKKLTTVIGGNNVAQIEQYAFYQCYRLKSFAFGSKLEYIGSGAFWSCSLSEVFIGENVTYIGIHAFLENELTSAVFKNTDGWKYSEAESGARWWTIDSDTLSDETMAAVWLLKDYYFQRN